MKKHKRTLKDLYTLAKGKPASCCETDSPSNAAKPNEAPDKGCSTKKEDSCC